jgi:hypothetical protein
MNHIMRIGTVLMCGLLLASCSGVAVKKTEPGKSVRDRRRDKGGKLLGDGLELWGADKKRDVGSGAGGGSGIGVNAHLWYASLDTISFMPLASADPFGGVIITDWYTPEQSPNERFKLNVFIMDRLLRSDAIKVKVFNEKFDSKMQQWINSPSDAKMAQEIENLILTRARQLRISSPSH